jgi:hypothetical protein
MNVVDAALLQLFAAEGADRDRYILQLLLTLLSGDRDFFQDIEWRA